MIFIDSFRDATMTKDLARQIKNEIHAFQHNTAIGTFRLTFNKYCTALFQKYEKYDVNQDLQEKDKVCLYLAYVYIMIEATGKSVMTSLITKLVSSESEDIDNTEEDEEEESRANNREESYLSDITDLINNLITSKAEAEDAKTELTDIADGFLKVQEFQSQTDRNWLYNMFWGKDNFICGAFRYDSTMWNEEDEQEYFLMYIGSLYPELKKHIEEFPCYDHLIDKVGK